MAIRRGTGSFARKHAKNFTYEQSEARLLETIPAIQDQQKNALGVDFYEVLVYQKAVTFQICTCKEVHNEPGDFGDGDVPPTILHHDAPEKEIKLDWRGPVFGTPNEASRYDDNRLADDADDFDDLEQTSPANSSPTLFQSDALCGLCYTTGVVPGYTLYGHQRNVFCTTDVNNIYGYIIDRTSAPNTFVPQDENECYVEFMLTIPRYFQSAKFTIRDNMEFVEEFIQYNGRPLVLRDLLMNAGRSIAIQVYKCQFTHCVVEFDLGKTVHANIAQITRVTDWTLFETIGNLDVVLPVEIPLPQTGDVIVVPKRRLALKVTDVPNMQDATGKNLDWRVSTRVLQPQEPLQFIAKLDKIL